MAVEFLPWLEPLWEGLYGRLVADRLPHAVLFTGPQGVGKRTLGEALARVLLCSEPDAAGRPCGHCRGCTLNEAGNHPDLLRIEPLEAGKEIGIDAIRNLITYQSLKPQYGERKVVIIDPAERVNGNAANALLKTLEEPASGTVLILCSARPDLLLPTIRSRCQVQAVAAPVNDPLARQWLQQRLGEAADGVDALLAMSGWAPLRALELVADETPRRQGELFAAMCALAGGRGSVLDVAAQAQQYGPEAVVAWIYAWVADMIRLKYGADVERLGNPERAPQLVELSRGADVRALFLFQDWLRQVPKLLRGQANGQLLMEELMTLWGRLCHSR